MTAMGRRNFALWIVATCLFVGGHANAQDRDRVTVKLFPAAPLPASPSETMDLQFERLGNTAPAAGERRPDRFFYEIARILSSHGITSNWQYVIPDGAFIRISIAIGKQRIELSSAHTLHERGGRLIATERGLVALDGRDPQQVLATQSEAFRSRRLAFEKILALVSARVRENLGQ
jgi:hypothetical protein